MSSFEELHDVLGRNTVHFLATSACITWMVSQEEGKVDERQELIIQATTQPRNNELKEFTHRYQEASVTLMPLYGERKVNEHSQGIVGVLRQIDTKLAIRLLVQPNYLIGLSNLIPKATDFPITISVWPFEKLWEWDGDGFLQIRECEITVGSINLKP